MMAEYHWPLDATLYGRPAAAIFALIPAIVERRGGDAGPSHADQAAIVARREKAAELRRTHRIIPNPQPSK